MSDNNPSQQINIELSQEIARGVYSNLVIISHSATEFIMDFVQVLPATPKAEVRSRVILHPQHAKRLLLAMNENLIKYEENHGEILIVESGPEFPHSFGGPAGIA